MAQYNESAVKTFTASAALGAHLRVKLTSGKAALAGSTDVELGNVVSEVFADGDDVGVRLRTAQGTCPCVAVDAITAGNPCYAAASGKVSASGTVLVGKSLETSTADGDIIEVVRAGESSAVAAAGGTTAAAFLVDSDATTPKIELAAQTGGTGDYKATIKPPATLTGNRVFTLPGDANATLVTTDGAQTLSGKSITIEKHTAGDTLTAAESGSIHSNTGASGTITIVLPAAVAGMTFGFYVGAAQELRLDPAGSETIALPSSGVQGAAGKYLVADAVGEHVRLVCETTGSWISFPYSGTWSAEA